MLRNKTLMLIQICYEKKNAYRMLSRKKFYENVKEDFNKKQKNHKNAAQQIKKLVQDRKVHNKTVKTELNCFEEVMALTEALNM